jgi:3-oxoacyl-[acyl-carrier protein] reductase
MLYEGRVAVVTGARAGVGRMVALHLLQEGCPTVIGLSRGPASIPEEHGYYHIPTDIGNNEQVRQAFKVIGRDFGRLDLLVNCAAVATSTYAILVPVAGAEEMVKTNILGLLYVAREAAKLMRKNNYGRIVNIGSIHAQIAPIGASIYAASKSAQETLVQVLSKEFADWKITVNTLALSPIETSMLRASGTPAVIQAVIDGLTIPRLAEPDDVMNGLDFYLSERSGFITGQTIYLGGVHG